MDSLVAQATGVAEVAKAKFASASVLWVRSAWSTRTLLAYSGCWCEGCQRAKGFERQAAHGPEIDWKARAAGAQPLDSLRAHLPEHCVAPTAALAVGWSTVRLERHLEPWTLR